MLRNHFYKVLSKEITDETSFTCRIKIDKDHAIFKGHFPSIPVVPGVCMMAIVKELLTDHLNKSITLESAGMLKFLSLINPENHNEVSVNIKYTGTDDGKYTADGSIVTEGLVFFKINKAVYN